MLFRSGGFYSHIEKRKSKCDYKISIAPTSEQIEAIEATVNEIINQHLSVTSFFVTRDNVPSDVDLSKLPDDASETLRIVNLVVFIQNYFHIVND